MRAEGWGWVDCLIEGDQLALRSYGRELQGEREPTPEEAQSLAAMEAERDELDAAYGRNENEDRESEAYEAEEQRLSGLLEAVDERIDTAYDALRQWSPEQMARSGALLRIDHGGNLTVDRGLIRPDDREASAEGGDSDGEGVTRRQDDASKKRPDISEKLMRDLTAHRTGALQAAMIQNPHVALATLVHRLAETVFGHYGRGNDVVKVHLTMTSDYSLAQQATDFENSLVETVPVTTSSFAARCATLMMSSFSHNDLMLSGTGTSRSALSISAATSCFLLLMGRGVLKDIFGASRRRVQENRSARM